MKNFIFILLFAIMVVWMIITELAYCKYVKEHPDTINITYSYLYVRYLGTDEKDMLFYVESSQDTIRQPYCDTGVNVLKPDTSFKTSIKVTHQVGKQPIQEIENPFWCK